jgi:hypothetical protein
MMPGLNFQSKPKTVFPHQEQYEMKREESKKQDQSIQTEKNQQPVVRVRSGLRAGLRIDMPCI